MQGLNTVAIVSDALDGVTLPTLTSPDLTNLTGDARSEALTAWGIQFYAFSVIAHVRSVLRGLRAVATTENIPPTFVLVRHIFEWTEQVCYVSEKFAQHVAGRDWTSARELLDTIVIGGKWVKEYGCKYGATPTTMSLPDTLWLKHARKSYEAYLTKVYGTEEKDDYGLLSEFSHPNAACLLQFHDTDAGGDVRFLEPTSGSPLPAANWCLVDLIHFLIGLLRLNGEQAVRPRLEALATRMSGMTSGLTR